MIAYGNDKELFARLPEEKNQVKRLNCFAILEEISSSEMTIFDVEMLYLQMKNKNYHVSGATV